MNEYIISRHTSGRLYAYFKGRFWRWDEARGIWLESHLMHQKYVHCLKNESNADPQEFLTDPENFEPLDEYEIPCGCIDALKSARSCKNAPIDPVEEESECATVPNADAVATTAENAAPNAAAETLTTSESAADASASSPAVSPQTCGSVPDASAEDFSAQLPSTTGCAPQDRPLTFIREDKCPEFDYSGLPEQTVETLHLAESGYLHGKKLAEKGLVYMGDNIALAHDELCGVVAQCDNSKHGNRGEDSFRAWCLHIGITKDSAYRLLQVSALLADSSPRQRAILESLPPTLLYAVAKPSAPQELVEQVKNGEVSTNKQYQELLKENQQLRTDRVNAMNQAEREKARADKAEAERDEACADQQRTVKNCYKLARKAAQEKDRADKVEGERDTLQKQLDGSRQVAEAAKLRAEKLQAENAALKKQPITAVVDEEEVDRRAGEKAYQMAADMTASLREQLEQATSGSEQDARNAYDGILLAGRTITNAWQAAKLLFAKLPAEQRETAANQLVHTLGQIQGEVSKCL